MDRRAKKLELKRKRREQVKKEVRPVTRPHARASDSLVRAAGRAAFGVCWVSVDWDDLEQPDLVQVVVTRRLNDGRFLPAGALVDRTCLGIKDGFVGQPLRAQELPAFIERVGLPHGGMLECEPLIAQSLVFHALDYARKLGFEPHAEFHEPLFGPRPSMLLATPWCAPERPHYIAAPFDDTQAIMRRLSELPGALAVPHPLIERAST